MHPALKFHLSLTSTHSYRPVGRNFQRGVRSIRQGAWGQLKAPRRPWVFGAKSCNLEISRHFIKTFGKPYFPLLIFKDFHQILHQLGISHSLNKSVNSFSKGGSCEPTQKCIVNLKPGFQYFQYFDFSMCHIFPKMAPIYLISLILKIVFLKDNF